MATYGDNDAITFQAGEDLRADIYRLIALDSDGHAILAVDPSVRQMGVLASIGASGAQSPSDAIGAHVGIVVSGFWKLICGAAVEAGNLLVPDAQGRAVPAADGQFTCCQALSSTGAAGEHLTCYIRAPSWRVSMS